MRQVLAGFRPVASSLVFVRTARPIEDADDHQQPEHHQQDEEHLTFGHKYAPAAKKEPKVLRDESGPIPSAGRQEL